MNAERWAVMLLAVLVGGCSDPSETLACEDAIPHARTVALTHFHGDARRLGWNDAEPDLRPETVGDGALARIWTSPPLDAAVIDGVEYPPLIYASPLYVEAVQIETAAGTAAVDLAMAATTNGWMYAVHAGHEARCGLEPGEIVWRTQVAVPRVMERLDKGVPLGILSTPVIDLHADPATVYVAAHDARYGWVAIAVELDSGQLRAGWPVALRDEVLDAVNANGPARFHEPDKMSQRGALQLSPSGETLYVAFGTFWGEGTGWLVAVDTAQPGVSAAFSSAPSSSDASSGGIWGSAGPAVDAQGMVWATTGNAPPLSGSAPGVWGSSLLQLSPDLELQRLYTPFNYCALDAANMDLGASQPLLIPRLVGTSTPDTVAFGSKQGNVYLVDRDAMRAAGQSRPACRQRADSDDSLLPPRRQPQFGTRGPLNVFGPYSDEFGEIDHAKMRTKLAYWEGPDRRAYLFASGSSKAAADSTVGVAPSVAKLRIGNEAGGPAYLAIDAVNPDVVMHNPGSPVVTSAAARGAIVWVLDRNAPRTAPVLDPATPRPVLYAFDATDLRLLWRSAPGELGPSGKYGSPTVARGQVLVGTDRVEAFGVDP